MIELIMMVLLLKIMKSQGKRKVRVFWRKEEEEKKERNVWNIKSGTQLNTQKGRDINKIPKIPF